MKFDATKLLNDKRVLYVVMFLVITNLVGYLLSGNYNAVLFFLLVCIFVRFFNQNKTIILSSALIATTLAIGGKIIKENFEGGPTKKASVKENASDMASSKKATTASHSKKTHSDKTTKKSGMANIRNGDDDSDADDDDNSFDNQEKIASGKKSQLDYAGTVESAYDNLDKLLSSDALKNMGMDTQRLAEKQKKLMGSIRNLEPMMNQANDLLKNLDMSGINNMMNKITNMSIMNDDLGKSVEKSK